MYKSIPDPEHEREGRTDPKVGAVLATVDGVIIEKSY